jgi:hypothetical protein
MKLLGFVELSILSILIKKFSFQTFVFTEKTPKYYNEENPKIGYFAVVFANFLHENKVKNEIQEKCFKS